jgi:5'(3')-deoxyribonucleotidase
MSKPIIAVDIDEVLSASAPDFVKFSNERWGTNLAVENYDEHWSEMWQVDVDETIRRRDVYLNSGLIGKHATIDGAYETLKRLSEKFEIVLVTSRSSALEAETKAWIETNYKDIASSVYFSGIFDGNFTADSFTHTKSDIFAELKPVFVIDDQIKHCRAAADLNINAILFGDYNWNHDYDGSNRLIVRCRDWQQVEERINLLSSELV